MTPAPRSRVRTRRPHEHAGRAAGARPGRQGVHAAGGGRVPAPRRGRRHLAKGPALEVGTYCGKSAIYLGAAARAAGSTVFTVDHHRGSEENQAGWEYHDPSLVDPEVGTDRHPADLPHARSPGPAWRRRWSRSSAAPPTVSALWRTPLALLFIDGGHTDEHAEQRLQGWGRWVRRGRADGRSTTCSPTRPTAARRRTASTCVRSRAATSPRSERSGRCGVLARVAGDAGDPVR